MMLFPIFYLFLYAETIMVLLKKTKQNNILYYIVIVPVAVEIRVNELEFSLNAEL